MGTANDKCANCNHKRYRHGTYNKEGNKVCMNMTCACPNFAVRGEHEETLIQYITRIQAQVEQHNYEKYVQQLPLEKVTPLPMKGIVMPDLNPKCANCGHPIQAHLTDANTSGVGECGKSDCQCPAYELLLPNSVELKDVVSESPPEENDDPVNHPKHYTAYHGVEVIQLTRWMSFNKGNAVKYIARAGLKDPAKEVEDLEKAIWYLQDELRIKKGEFDGS